MAIDRFSGEYAFLSNFFDSPVVLDGVTYPTVEHAFQAAKTLDWSQREVVLAQITPGNAKRAGRRVHLRVDWEEVKEVYMLDFLRQKFAVEPLRSKLLATGEQDLIEGNTWNDMVWGAVNRGGEWVGKNRLGLLLMQVREEER